MDCYRHVRRGVSEIATGEVGAEVWRIATGVFPRVESQIAAGEVGAKALRIRSNGTLYFISPNAIPVLLGCDNVDHFEKSQGLPS
jgi:hypothetical protein